MSFPLRTDRKIVRAPVGFNDGRGIVFISRVGLVQPSDFLPLADGIVREKPLAKFTATHPFSFASVTIRNSRVSAEFASSSEFAVGIVPALVPSLATTCGATHIASTDRWCGERAKGKPLQQRKTDSVVKWISLRHNQC